MYLIRAIDEALLKWKEEPDRKVLLVRGARQVGKSSSVRQLGKLFDSYLEVNFEEHKRVHSLFEGDLTPAGLCEGLSVMFDMDIIPGKTLLFFDEIQACVPAISSLRFFYEKMPGLHVIAAGSLLEFALAELPSFGVGRTRSIFMYPLSFHEFLDATGHTGLKNMVTDSGSDRPLPEAIHEKALMLLKKFLLLGGMPEIVAKYAMGIDIRKCQAALDDLISSLNADFSKYKYRMDVSRLREVFASVVQQSGGKFVYKKVSQDLNTLQIKEALEMLIMAGMVIPATHTSANGLPLGAGANPKLRKMLLIDTGMFQRILKLDISELLFADEFNLVNKGAIAEQFTGLELIKYSSPFSQEGLFYWRREALNSNAEIDYLIQKKSQMVPIEVKSGTKGSMNSLFLFLSEKKAEYGIRVSLENFTKYEKIKVFPLYAVANILQNE